MYISIDVFAHHVSYWSSFFIILFSSINIYHTISHYYIRLSSHSIDVSFMLLVSSGLCIAAQLDSWLSPLLSDFFNIYSSLDIHNVVCQYSVILYVNSEFFVTSQLAPWFFLFNYTTSLLVSMFTILSLVLMLLLDLSCIFFLVCDYLSAHAIIISVFLWFHDISSGFCISVRFIFSITRRFF